MTEVLEKEATSQQEPIDILSGQHQCHWTFRGKLPNILSRGIYSAAFATRIGDEEYEALHTADYAKPPKHVWVSNVVQPPHPQMRGEGLAGIIVDVSQEREVPFRVRPSKFQALVLDDEYSSWPDKKKRIKGISPQVFDSIRAIYSSNQMQPLPIYGISGDLYWPKRISHEEIVQMLKERERSPKL